MKTSNKYLKPFFEPVVYYEYANWLQERAKAECVRNRYLHRLNKKLEDKQNDDVSGQNFYENDLYVAEINCLKFDIKEIERHPIEKFAARNGLKYPSFNDLSKNTKAFAFCLFALERMDDEDKAEPNIAYYIEQLVLAVAKYVEKFPYSMAPRSCFGKDFDDFADFKKILATGQACLKHRPEVKHRALTKYFKRHFLDEYREIKGILENCQVSRRVGNLPPQWRMLIDKKDIKAKTMQIDEALSLFAAETYSPPEAEIKNSSRRLLEKRLSEILTTDVKVTELGRGEIKKAYKISTKSGDVVLSTNHSWQRFNSVYANHGNTKEVALGLFINQSYSQRDYVKTYMGKIGLDGQVDTYGLTEYVKPEEDYKDLNSEMTRYDKISKGFCYDASYITNVDDTDENRLNGVFIDIGGVVMPSEYKDRMTFTMVIKIIKALATNNVDYAQSMEEKYQKTEKERWLNAKKIVAGKIKEIDASGPIETVKALKISILPEINRMDYHSL